MYLLDSNVCIRLLNERAGSNMTQKMAEISPEDIRLCSVVKSELYYGSSRFAPIQNSKFKIKDN